MALKNISQNVWIFGLERVRLALDRLGCPEKTYRHLVVAGTNGKGSTCVYLESILLTLGFSVGTNISPHVTDFGERFRINGRNAGEDDLAELHEELGPALDDIGLTYFEWCVVLAAVIFRRCGVDFGIFEVGLGGRYDAANALDPEICLITDVGLDHMDLLGSTVEEIAREKAAIARKGRPLITTATGPALEVIRECAREAGAAFSRVDAPAGCPTSLKGPSQPMNAALAIAAARALGLSHGEEQLRQALQSAFLPGRTENIGGRVILDVAHNPAAVRELLSYLEGISFQGVGVFGVLKDKDYPAMLAMLKGACSTLFIAPVHSERSWGEAEMELVFDPSRMVRCGSVSEAFQKAVATGKTVVVTGSFYTVGEVRGSIPCPGS